MAQTDTWITVAESDVLASINNSELTAALSTAPASGQTASSVIAELIANATLRVRGYVRRRNTLGPAGTIPQELEDALIDIVIYRAACRVNKAAAEKKPAYDEAMKMLRDVARGDMRVSAPLTPSTDVTSAEGPAMECKRPRFGYEEERGI